MNAHEKEAWQRMANNLDAISTDTKYTSALRYASEIIHELIAEVERIDAERVTIVVERDALAAQLAAVPVDDIKKVNNAAENDGYSNWAVSVWLDELAQAKEAQ